jgi:RNA polymerase sigma-70 factor (ECF subfamily)
MEDCKIVDLYFERSQDAIKETDKKYGRYLHYIAYRILESDEDAKEIVNDTYLKAWNTIPPNRPEALKAYVGMISRQLAINRYEEKRAKKRSGESALVLDELAECISAGEGSQDIGESVALKNALNSFVHSLSGNTRNVFLKRYWYASSIAEIAREYKMKESSVKVLLMRTRNKLKEYLIKEGFEI